MCRAVAAMEGDTVNTTTRILGFLGLCLVGLLVGPLAGRGQEKPPLQLPEVVVVGQEARVVQEGKAPIQPQTVPIGLRGDLEAGKLAYLTLPETGDLAGPAAENPGCLLFPRLQGARDEVLYRRGIDRFNDGRYGEAVELFTRLLETYQTSPYRGAAAFWTGEALYRQNDAKAALPWYEEVATRYQREPLRDYALFRLAQLHLEREDHAQAASYLQDLLVMYPASPTIEPALYLFGESAFRLGQYQRAMEVLGSFLQRYPRSALRERAELWRAESLYQLQRYREALLAYQGFLERYPRGTLRREARYGLAWALLKLDAFQDARQIFQELARQYQDAHYDEAVYYAAFAHAIGDGKLPEAEEQWERLVQRYPQGRLLPIALGKLAWAYFSRRNYDAALVRYQQLAHQQQAPERLRDVAQYMLGECFYQQGNYAEAAETFRQIRAEASGALLEKATLRLGLAQYHLEDYAQAVQVLQAFVRRYAASPYRDAALFWLAEAHFRQEDYAAALEAYERVPPGSRLSDYALYGKGWVRLRQHQWRRAIEVFQHLVAQAPQTPPGADAVYRLAESYQNLGQYEQARQHYDRYLRAHPNGPQAPLAQLQVALLALQADRFQDAVQALRHVQKQFAGTEQAGEAQYWLGMAYFRRQQYAQARAVLQQLANVAPEHPRAAAALLRVADAYYNENRFRDSLIAYRKVSILHPESPLVVDAQYGTILSYYRLRKYPQFLREARAFLRHFAQHPLSVALLMQMAEYHQEHQHYDEAIQTYTRLVRQHPRNDLATQALLRLGELYMTTGRPQRAAEAYERLLRDGQAGDLRPQVLFAQAQAYEQLGQADAAVQRYTQLVQRYPEHALVVRGLYQAGKVLLAQQRYREAQQRFETIVRRYPDESLRFASLLQLGRIQLRLDRPQEAISLFRQVQEAPDPRLAAQAYFQLGEAYSQAGDLQQGIKAYLRVSYLYPDEEEAVVQALRQAARNYVALGNCAEARAVYGKLLERLDDAGQTREIQQERRRGACQ
jgi:TolA-binding protein